jgi:ferredoxin
VIFKVLPVNQSVNTDLEIHPYDIAEEMVQNAKSWGVRECICKAQQGLLGNDCKYPTTVCLMFAPRRENAYDNDELTKVITKDEALKLLKDAEDAGLVHCTMNARSDHYYICNCCTCCCGILRGLDSSDNPRAFVRTEFVANIDADLCSGCETCIDRCQFGALSIPEDVTVVDTKRCIGCGVCAVTCPEGAIEIVRTEPTGKSESPEGLMDWMTQRAMSRDIDPSDLL